MKPEMKKLIIANLPYLLFVYLFGKLGQTYRLAAGADLSEKLLHLADGFSLAFESAAPSFHLFDLAVGVAGAVALRLMVYCNGSYPHASTPKEPTYYEIPPEALKDEAFAAMIAEAEKYMLPLIMKHQRSPTFPSTKCRPARRGATSATVLMRTCRRMGFRWTGRITSLSTPRRWTRTPHWTRFTAAST